MNQTLLQRIGQWYSQLAILLLNTLLLLIILTVFAYVYYGARKNGLAPAVYSAALKTRAMHRMNAEEATKFFKLFDRLGAEETFIYQPWVGFSERVFHAEGLNVDEAMPMPIRRTWQSVERGGKPLVVWIFGGSTMFGWGVPDDQTIASHLTKMLAHSFPERDVKVINYGHSYFFSSQELALFQMLLRRGERCDFAIFLDGLNDSIGYSFEDRPAFTERMRAAFEKEQGRNPTADTHFWISPEFPPLKLLAGIQARLVQRRVAPPATVPTYDAARKYQVNMATEAALGDALGIQTLFFWQPVPNDSVYAPARELAWKVRQSMKSEAFHFVADLFEGANEADVYVDQHHYGDTACERVAEAIGVEIVAAAKKN